MPWPRNISDEHVSCTEVLNFQKCSENDRFLTCWLQNLLWATTPSTSWTSQRLKMLRSLCNFAFWLPNVLRATTGCTFSISHLQQVLWDRGALNILTFKSASRHSRVQFFIPPFPKCLRTRRFSEPPTSRPSGATKHWKSSVFRTFLPFRTPWSSFYWLFLSSDYTCPKVGSFTSILPSVI